MRPAALAHLRGPQARRRDFDEGHVAHVRPEESVVLVAFDARPGVSKDAVQLRAWTTLAAAKSADVVESYVYRGPPWTLPSGRVVKAGSWVLGVRLSPRGFQQFEAGNIGPSDLLQSVLNPERASETMKTGKILKQLQKQVSSAPAIPSTSRPHVTGVSVAGSGATTIGSGGTANRVVASVLAGLEDRVTKAEAELAVASTSGNEMARVRARGALKLALRNRLVGKMLVAENARAAGRVAPDPLLGRFGGERLFKEGSTYSVGEDRDVQYR